MYSWWVIPRYVRWNRTTDFILLHPYIISLLKTCLMGVEKMAQRLRTFSVFAEDLAFPALIRQLTSVCGSSSRASNVLFWHLGHQAYTWCTYIHMQARHSNAYNKSTHILSKGLIVLASSPCTQKWGSMAFSECSAWKPGQHTLLYLNSLVPNCCKHSSYWFGPYLQIVRESTATSESVQTVRTVRLEPGQVSRLMILSLMILGVL